MINHEHLGEFYSTTKTITLSNGKKVKFHFVQEPCGNTIISPIGVCLTKEECDEIAEMDL